MIVVIDASVAVSLVVNPGNNVKEAEILSEASWVLAPTLFVSEVTNAFWKYHTFQNLPQDKAAAGIALALELPDSLADDTELQVEAFALSCRTRHSVYDMMYLILARRNDALLMTKDKALEKLASEHDVRVIQN